MIIVSQDKTAHINYDNIEATYLLKKDDKIKGKYECIGNVTVVFNMTTTRQTVGRDLHAPVSPYFHW